MIFLRVLPNFFLWPHYSGAPGARGPRFIEPPEPPVPTPLMRVLMKFVGVVRVIRFCYSDPDQNADTEIFNVIFLPLRDK